ncbi:hypothetical protein A0H81_10131 [Grifola frondosa]|uniref:Rho GTPase-activating protein 23 n=1 Tax=Grifola frondosa TaxID=5627 RepID=A0A1C7M0P2_GRIFR|nr:hypothetical protein A0H81_10131 [Grifola frondosa]
MPPKRGAPTPALSAHPRPPRHPPPNQVVQPLELRWLGSLKHEFDGTALEHELDEEAKDISSNRSASDSGQFEAKQGGEWGEQRCVVCADEDHVLVIEPWSGTSWQLRRSWAENQQESSQRRQVESAGHFTDRDDLYSTLLCMFKLRLKLLLDEHGACRSVVDLSLARTVTSAGFDHAGRSSRTPSSPSQPMLSSRGGGGGGLGDLRNLSRKPWSKSADDLGKQPGQQQRAVTVAVIVAIDVGAEQLPIPGDHDGSVDVPAEGACRGGAVDIIAGKLGDVVEFIRHRDAAAHAAGADACAFTVALVHAAAAVEAVRAEGGVGASESIAQRVWVVRARAGRDREREKSGAGAGAMKMPPPTEDGPSFPFPSSGLLAPPTIVEPDETKSDKRTSQPGELYVHDRSRGPALAKGWKPFKLVFKGSKLYFYKPPSDRSAAVKELFPTELVAVLDDEELVGPEPEPEPEMNDGDFETGGRAVRVKNGKRPGGAGREQIERGTFEALVHEAVFSTTFIVSPDSPPEDQPPARYKADWRDLSSSILLCMPSLAGKAAFEAEFIRCCTFLLNGTEDNVMEEEKARVSWLVNQYLDYHGIPENREPWESWLKDTLPDFSPGPDTTSKPAGLEFSPNLSTFSPRPNEGNKMMSIVEALGETISATPTAHSAAMPPEKMQSTLDRDGLSKDLLLRLDPQMAARSLYVFHVVALQLVPNNFTAEFCLPPCTREVENSASGSPASHLSPFLGTDEQPHWLTRTILVQVLVPEPTGGASTSLPQDSRLHPTSRTHSRSEVISAWARVGEECRRLGDECSWRAIIAALCSRPVARLDKVWKRVDHDALAVVQTWVQHIARGESTTLVEPKAIPWAGDVQRQVREALEKARYGDADEWSVSHLAGVREKFDSLRTTFALCTTKADFNMTKEGQEVEMLMNFWKSCSEGSSQGSIASKFTRVDQFMSLSLAAESRRRGLFEPYFWSRMGTQQTVHPLAALLFPEPLPTVSFINRALIMRGRLESNASGLNVQDLQYIREARTKPDGERNPKPDAAKPNGLDLGGTIIPVFNHELLLLVQPGGGDAPSSRPASRAPSRPPSSVVESPTSDKSFSRAPSIRVTAGSSHGIERKPSALRRNSLPPMSQRSSLVASEVSSERPLRVIVQAGTLDRLVDILAHGLQGVAVSVSDDNGEMSLKDKKLREVRVDMDDFSRVWWSTFRSFLTPQVLFEFLRKRYVGAHLKGQSLTPEDIPRIVHTRSEVLETMSEWIMQGGGAQDILDDAMLFESFQTFLTLPTEQELLESIRDKDANVLQTLKALDDVRKNLHMSFVSQTMRPSPRPSSTPDAAVDGHGMRSRSSELPDIDQLDAEELVANLNAMASSAFRNVTQEDLLITSDLLEVQSADRTGWFLFREASCISDEVEIQSMSSYILEVEPSPMISELTQDTLYRLLPPAIRSCIRAFGILRKWLISKLVPLRLGLRTRQARMELMLRAIEVCRLRNFDSTTSNLPLAERPCVRSFAEAVLTIVEVNSMPDVLESAYQDKIILVNFDKRRSLHSLVSSTSGPAGVRRHRQRREADRRDIERLNGLEKELSSVHFDLRSIREEAHREAAQANTSLAKIRLRPFQTLVAIQQEKNRRDKSWRDRLSKEKRQEQLRNDKREEYLNKAMNPRRQNPVLPKQHRNKKSMSSAFFQFMRPISSAFSSDSLSTSTVKRTPAELDFTPTHKPSLVLTVVNARVAQFVNNERSFTFQLDTEDGGHYLLQALNKPDMKKWTETIERVSTMAAKRRLTYLGQNPQPQLSDHLMSRPSAPSRDPRAVFGVELEILLRREAPNDEVQPGAIPSVLERLICEVENRGLTEIGIYRIAGAHTEVNAHKDAINRGEWSITPMTDIHAVCDLIKSWFRVLPGGIFPAPLYSAILEVAARDDVDLDTKLSNVRQVVHSLPESNFDLLKRIVEHLEKVTDYEESNQMTAESLATVFSPNLMRSPNNDIGAFFANMGAGHRVTKILIAHFHIIFDTDAEQDRDQEEYEYDEPIPEEDEEDIFVDEPEASEDLMPRKLASGPPTLDIDLGSPHSLSFSITST